MLIVEIQNDGTGPQASANYNVRVRANLEVLKEFRVEGHNRADGWQKLLEMVAQRAQEAQEDNQAMSEAGKNQEAEV